MNGFGHLRDRLADLNHDDFIIVKREIDRLRTEGDDTASKFPIIDHINHAV